MRLRTLVLCATLSLTLAGGRRGAGPAPAGPPALATARRPLNAEAWVIRLAAAPGTRFGEVLADWAT